jgi:hypothetical protein
MGSQGTLKLLCRCGQPVSRSLGLDGKTFNPSEVIGQEAGAGLLCGHRRDCGNQRGKEMMGLPLNPFLNSIAGGSPSFKRKRGHSVA